MAFNRLVETFESTVSEVFCGQKTDYRELKEKWEGRNGDNAVDKLEKEGR